MAARPDQTPWPRGAAAGRQRCRGGSAEAPAALESPAPGCLPLEWCRQRQSRAGLLALQGKLLQECRSRSALQEPADAHIYYFVRSTDHVNLDIVPCLLNQKRWSSRREDNKVLPPRPSYKWGKLAFSCTDNKLLWASQNGKVCAGCANNRRPGTEGLITCWGSTYPPGRPSIWRQGRTLYSRRCSDSAGDSKVPLSSSASTSRNLYRWSLGGPVHPTRPVSRTSHHD